MLIFSFLCTPIRINVEVLWAIRTRESAISQENLANDVRLERTQISLKAVQSDKSI